MMLLCSRFLYLLLAIATLSIQLSAQVGRIWVDSDAAGNSSSPAEGSTESENRPASAYEPFTDWPVLVVPGVIQLGDLEGAGIVYGGGLAVGYGKTEVSVNEDATGWVSVVQPYVGAFQAGARHKLLLQYSPTIDLFRQNQWDGGVLQRGGIAGFDDLSRRLRWVFSGYTTNGQEYLRGLDGLSLGEYPGWLTLTVPTETVFAAAATTGLYFRRKPQQEFQVLVGDAYSSVRHGPHYDANWARVQMNNYFTQNSEWYVYGEGIHNSNQPDCTRIGVGGGLDWHISGSTQLGLAGGPVYGNGTCVVHVSSTFNGHLIQRLTASTVLSLGATRDLVEPYLLQSRWLDIFSARIMQKTSRNTRVEVGAAYTQSSDVPGETIARYRGLLLLADFGWRLSDSLNLHTGYRYFKREFEDPSSVNRDSWVFLSIVWHPWNRSARR